MTHEVDWFYKYPSDKFNVEFDFTKDLDVDTLTSVTATAFNSADVAYPTMVASVAVSSPDAIMTVRSGVAGETYNIKMVGVSSSGKHYTHYVKCEVFGNITLNTKLGDMNTNSYVTVTEANTYIRKKYGHDSRWDTLTTEGKKAVLVEAAREIDSYNFINEKYYESQSMQFPRSDHTIVTGNCAATITATAFKHTSLKSSTYGTYPTNYWTYGTCHITVGTPVYDIRNIARSNVITGHVAMDTAFTATPTTNTQFIIFSPLFKEVKDAQCEQALYILESQHAETLQNYRNIGAKRVAIGDVEVDFVEGASGENVAIAPISKKLLSRWIRKQLRIARA